MCFGVPLPPYIKEEREEASPRGVPSGGDRLGLLVLVSPSFFRRGEREGDGEGEVKGAAPPPLVQFGLPWGGATPCGLPSLSPMAHVGPLLFPGGSGSPSELR